MLSGEILSELQDAPLFVIDGYIYVTRVVLNSRPADEVKSQVKGSNEHMQVKGRSFIWGACLPF